MSPFQSMQAQPTSSSTECPMNAEQCFGAERWGQTPKLHSALETGREASKLLTADVPCAQTICTLGSNVLFKKNPCPPFVTVAWVSLADLHHMSPLLPTSQRASVGATIHSAVYEIQCSSGQGKRQGNSHHSCPRNC